MYRREYTELQSSVYVQKRVYRTTELCLCTEENIHNNGALFMYRREYTELRSSVYVMERVYIITKFCLCIV